MKTKEHLPILGVGPFYVASILLLTFLAVLGRKLPFLSSGNLVKFRIPLMILGGLCIGLAAWIWIQAVLIAKLDAHIKRNQLLTTGIYAWVRNPVYTAFMLLCTGITLLIGNAWFFILPFLYWGLLTVLMKNTEEKWLKDRYGNEYTEYCKKVNRCWPWIPRG